MRRQIEEQASTFPLTSEQQALLDRAAGLTLELEDLIGHALGRWYLRDLDTTEE